MIKPGFFIKVPCDLPLSEVWSRGSEYSLPYDQMCRVTGTNGGISTLKTIPVRASSELTGVRLSDQNVESTGVPRL